MHLTMPGLYPLSYTAGSQYQLVTRLHLQPTLYNDRPDKHLQPDDGSGRVSTDGFISHLGGTGLAAIVAI